MNYLSFWEKESFFDDADVVIVGSGLVGISTAIALKELDAGLKVTVIERGALPCGASTKNAGFACFGSMTEILDDLGTNNEEDVFSLVRKRWTGLQKLRARTGDPEIRYQPLGGYEVFKSGETAVFEECLGQMMHFNQIIESITGEKNAFTVADRKIPEFGFQQTGHLIFNRLEGQLHAGEMMKTLIRLATVSGIQLINGLEVSELLEEDRHVRIQTSNGWSLRAGKVLVATNGFARQFFPDLELWPARNQVLITKPLEHLPFLGAFHYDKGYVYFRNVDVPGSAGQSRILLGGGRNLDPIREKTSGFGTTEIIQHSLLKLLNDVILPGRPIEIDGWWSGILGLGASKKPIIRMHSPRIGVAVRLGGMGVALGTLVGQEAAEMIFQK